jgi:hypothetical protein
MLHTTVLAAFSKVYSISVSAKKQEGSLFILNLGISPISGITVCQFIVSELTAL